MRLLLAILLLVVAFSGVASGLELYRNSRPYHLDITLPYGGQFSAQGIDRVFDITGIKGILRLIQDQVSNCDDLVSARIKNKARDGFGLVRRNATQGECYVKLKNNRSDEVISSFYVWRSNCSCFAALHVWDAPGQQEKRNVVLQSVLDQLRGKNVDVKSLHPAPAEDKNNYALNPNVMTTHDIEFGYDFIYKVKIPSRFNIMQEGSDDSRKLFSDNDEHIRIKGTPPFNQNDFRAIADTISNSIKTHINGEAKLFHDDISLSWINFEERQREINGRSAFVRSTSSDGKTVRLDYVVLGCCVDTYLYFTYQGPISANRDWLKEFYITFANEPVAISPRNESARIELITLPETKSPALGEHDGMYDACAKLWNQHSYYVQRGHKVMMAYAIDARYGCKAIWSKNDLISSIDSLMMKECNYGTGKCQVFDQDGDMSEWAEAAMSRVKFGGRENDTSGQQNEQDAVKSTAPPQISEPRNASRPSQSDGFFDDFLGAAGAMIEGAAAGAAIVDTVTGGGLTGGGYVAGGRGNNGEVCAQLQSMYEECRRSWETIGSIGGTGGTGDDGQDGSFYQCMTKTKQGMIAKGCR